MASNFSFDIVSYYDKGELNNVYDQAQREIMNRYDLKGTKAKLEWSDSDKNAFKITGDSDFHIDAILDIIRKKLASREQSQKVLDVSEESITTNLQTTKIVPLKSGINQENAKKISTLIRDNYPKVKSQIQGEELRIMSPKKDDLQKVMDLLRQQNFNFALQFINYR